MKSKIIVIEGLDGSGKATQTALLAEKLTKKGTYKATVKYSGNPKNVSKTVKIKVK